MTSARHGIITLTVNTETCYEGLDVGGRYLHRAIRTVIEIRKGSVFSAIIRTCVYLFKLVNIIFNLAYNDF